MLGEEFLKNNDLGILLGFGVVIKPQEFGV
jgi:hypothetical protein